MLTSSFVSQAQFRIVGYLTNWGGSLLADAQKVDHTKVTHVNIAFYNPSDSMEFNTSSDLLATNQSIPFYFQLPEGLPSLLLK